jgi:hypothetical protein
MVPSGQQVEDAAPSDGSPLGNSNDRYWPIADVPAAGSDVRFQG